jgi:hypothetical protein
MRVLLFVLPSSANASAFYVNLFPGSSRDHCAEVVRDMGIALACADWLCAVRWNIWQMSFADLIAGQAISGNVM